MAKFKLWENVIDEASAERAMRNAQVPAFFLVFSYVLTVGSYSLKLSDLAVDAPAGVIVAFYGSIVTAFAGALLFLLLALRIRRGYYAVHALLGWHKRKRYGVVLKAASRRFYLLFPLLIIGGMFVVNLTLGIVFWAGAWAGQG